MIELNIELLGYNNQIEMTGFDLVEYKLFKGGEPNPKLNDYQIIALRTAKQAIVKAHLSNMDAVWAMVLTVDAIRRVNPKISISAVIPYVPFARQDRVCNAGEAISIVRMAKTINDLEFDEVLILDPHSDVTGALINKATIVPLADYILSKNVFPSLKLKETYLVAPDAGAQKKVKAMATALGCKGYITASKERDLETMEVTATRFDGDVSGKKLLVVDDICDGGRTFIALAKALRTNDPKELHLWVTHGIFSYGTEVVTEHFDSVGTTNSFQYDALEHVDGSGNIDPKMTWVRI